MKTTPDITALTFECAPAWAAFLKQGGIGEGSALAAEARAIFDAVARHGAPKAMLRVCAVEEVGPAGARIGGAWFASKTLARNLKGVDSVVAHVCTCGAEIDALGLAGGDPLYEWWVDVLKAQLLMAAREGMLKAVERLMPGKAMDGMSPGSGDADVWPIADQKPLFGLFQGREQDIGVTLTESCLMVPNKSVSGIWFPSENGFRMCQVCRRATCVNRSAPFDAALWEEVHQD